MLRYGYKHEAQASEFAARSGIHSLALRACIPGPFVRKRTLTALPFGGGNPYLGVPARAGVWSETALRFISVETAKLARQVG